MTPRTDALARVLDTERAQGGHANSGGANAIKLSEEDLRREHAGTQREPREEVEEFYRRAASKGKLDAGRTVRSGMAFDFGSTEPVPPADAERAARVKAQLGGGPLRGIEGRYGYRFVKRTFDVSFSLAVLVAFSWLFLIIALAVKIDDPKGPVFFGQKRVGWSIIGQKSGAARGKASRTALSALEAWRLRHLYTGLGVAA